MALLDEYTRTPHTHAYVLTNSRAFQGIAVFLFEAAGWFGIQEMLAGSGREPGDFAMDPLNYCGTAEGKADMKLKEITHCRLAMLAFGGMVTQAVAVSDQFPYMGLDGKF